MNFAFKVGQICKVKGTVADTYGKRWLIVERTYQECPAGPAGAQRHYACRGITFDGDVLEKHISFNEIELEPSRAFTTEDRMCDDIGKWAKAAAPINRPPT